MTPVSTVAKAVLQVSPNPISNLKLQKILYYVQGWSLGIRGIPVFNERIEAWVHGPVVPEIFYVYRPTRWNPIPKPTEQLTVPEEELRHIENVITVYGRFSARQLEEFSHEEEPWQNARVGFRPHEISSAVITHEAMKSFFEKRANA